MNRGLRLLDTDTASFVVKRHSPKFADSGSKGCVRPTVQTYCLYAIVAVLNPCNLSSRTDSNSLPSSDKVMVMIWTAYDFVRNSVRFD